MPVASVWGEWLVMEHVDCLAVSARIRSRRAARRLSMAIGLIAGLAALAVPGFVSAASAAEFNVTGTADGVAECEGSSCPSLRAAVIASNLAGGTNKINVP